MKIIKNSKKLFSGLSYMPGNTAIYRMHPLTKLLILIFYSIAVFAYSQPIPAVILAVILLISYVISGLGFGFFIRKLRFVLMFGIMIILIQILTVHTGELLFDYLIINKIRLEIWSNGLSAGVVMMLRFINVIGSSYLFVTTTDPNKLVYSLMQAGLPYRQGFMLITSLRFIPVFNQELALVRNAQMAKGIEFEGISPKKLLRAVKYLLTPLVICALNKVDYLAISMESRAFGLYTSRTYLIEQNLKTRDLLYLFTTPIIFISFCHLILNRL